MKGRKIFKAIEFAANASAEKLTQEILAKALRGEPVPTEAELARREGRFFEPASALLVRSNKLDREINEVRSEPAKTKRLMMYREIQKKLVEKEKGK